MKNRRKKVLFGIAAIGILLGLLSVRERPVDAATKVLTQISAVYLGDSVEVGKSIDSTKLYVTAYYVTNGRVTSETVKSGYTVTPSVVSATGQNTLVVYYQGYSATITVSGKRPVSLTAVYNGTEVTVGNDFSEGNLKVTVVYSDGTSADVKDYVLPSKRVTAAGDNYFVVTYSGLSASFTVPGKDVLAVEQLIAYYYGEDVIVGNSIDKTKISVYAVYNDGTMEEVKQFNLTPATVMREGENTVVVSYGGCSAEIFVYGLEKEVVSFTAEYIGAGVILGETVDVNEVRVMATYNDGTVERTTAFQLSGSLITMEGENVVLVYCGGMIEQIIVPGVKGFTIDFTNQISTVVFSESLSYSTVTLALDQELGKNSFFLTQIDPLLVKQAVRRVVNTEDYIAFTVTYDDDEMVRHFPMAMRVTRPSDYDADQFAVYYTPNQKTIMAKLNGEYIEEAETTYQFLIYEPGTYIIVHAENNQQIEEIVLEENITVKAGRNYSLNPVVLPKTAVNQKLTYWSDDEEVATVSENGKVKTYRKGICNIWVEATDGSGVHAIVTLKVEEN